MHCEVMVSQDLDIGFILKVNEIPLIPLVSRH